MFEAFFCQGVFLRGWCVRSWGFIVAVVLIYLGWKFFVPKEKKV